MLRQFTADLHLHTVLSPCAEVEMIPPLIIRTAEARGINLLAVTDHNSAENVQAVMRAAVGSTVHVLPGMEVETREEVHIICLFDKLKQVWQWQEIVYANLPPLQNKAEVFGAQFVVDGEGEFLRYNDRLLLTPTNLSVEQVVQQVDSLGGLCIPAHVDRPAYSILVKLGFIPPNLALSAVEIAGRGPGGEVLLKFPCLKDYTIISCSDAHRLDDIAKRKTIFFLETPSIAEISLALKNQEGRKVVVPG